MNNQSTGKVYLTGAGPGDASLITVKAARILAKADVVITDRLVSQALLDEYVNPLAVIIPVGKQGGSNGSTSQAEISNLIVQCAGLYATVVRLKGGDVSVFSNILDELQVLVYNDIDYEIIPGISAFAGAAAYTGIPLTARGYSTGVRLLTHYQHHAISDGAWKQLATFEETLVFYMSGNNLSSTVHKLLESGAIPTMPFVVVEQATTPNQYVYEYSLESFANQPLHPVFQSPSLIIMGSVTSLYKNFKWKTQSSNRKPFFPNLKEYPELIQLLNNLQNIKNADRA